jgi:HD-GYP domain-containing protein (c-di-GMP phosphodiesterase class II)/DNA-binding CsgD family transcriptional regulator
MGKEAEPMMTSAESVQPPAGYVRTADVISALSVAADLALGLPAEHSARTCYIATEIGRLLGVTTEQQGELYYTALLLDAGCTAYASTFADYLLGDEMHARQELFFNRDVSNPLDVFDWMRRFVAADAALPIRAGRIMEFLLHGREMLREGFHNTCEVSNRFAGRLGMPPTIQHALLYVFEQWDGNGLPSGTRGDAIPATARVANAAFYLEIAQASRGRDAALRLARDRRGKAFDPQIVDAFIALAEKPDFWETLGRETVLDTVRALEPVLPYRFIHEEKLLDVALFAADFADVKSRYTVGHSRRVADIAAGMASSMSLPEAEVRCIHLAALFHDLGLVAVPSFVLEKPRESLASSEWEAIRLHPYHAERILSRVPVLREIARVVGAHHERVDGQGYYRGLAGSRIPLGARILAVADTFDELTHDGPGRPAQDVATAVARMHDEVGRAFDPDAFAALLDGEMIDPGIPRGEIPHQRWPAGLTDREVEVLRLAAKGLTRKKMADALFVSPSTVRSHLEHIYAKIGVSTRAAATLFAVEHDLIA